MFVVIFVSVYGLMHYYLFRWVRRILPSFKLLHILFGLYCLFMVGSTFLIRISDKYGYPGLSALVATVAYPWMGCLLWFCVTAPFVDIWNRIFPARALPVRPAFAVMLGLIATAAVYGTFEASKIRVVEMSIRCLARDAKPIRLVQVSDVHVSVYRGRHFLPEIVRRIEALKPDVLVCTGDLIDSRCVSIEYLAEMLKGINPPLGKFAVLGNHDYYIGMDDALAFHKRAGFRVLRQEAVPLAGSVLLAGVDDVAGRYTGNPCYDDEAALSTGNAGFVSILLKHQPELTVTARKNFDFQLSGHTHGGQMFPFNLFVSMFYPVVGGMSHQAGDRVSMYVNRGVGTWGPPFRFLIPPEITLIKLEPQGPGLQN